jgi:hypothetical protein
MDAMPAAPSGTGAGCTGMRRKIRSGDKRPVKDSIGWWTLRRGKKRAP